jgi:transposase InsO family protein
MWTRLSPARRARTTDSRHALPIAPNLIARDFTAAAPNRVWLADITYIQTDEGWLYLAAIMDLFSRKIVGWAMRDHLRTELASAALMIAIQRQRPAARLIHHSDRGVQYASHDYRAILAATDSSLWRSSSIWSANLAAPWPRISKYAPLCPQAFISPLCQQAFISLRRPITSISSRGSMGFGISMG